MNCSWRSSNPSSELLAPFHVSRIQSIVNGLLLAAEVRNLMLLNHGGHHITDQSSLLDGSM